MPILKEFHKPTSLSDALTLLKRKNPRTIPLAGGTWLNPRLGKEVPAEAVVDLSELGLDQIKRDANTLCLGAMTTLEAVIKDETCRSLANGILAQTADRDTTVNVRNVATVGGTVVVAPEGSEFLLALLALGAKLNTIAPSTLALRTIAHSTLSPSEEATIWSMHQFLAHPVAVLNDELVIKVQIHLPVRAASGTARVARTPSDHPIVAAVAVIAKEPDAIRIALSGVGPHLVLVEFDQPEEAGEAVSQSVADTKPCTDFRGTVDYRRAMGVLMAKRALEQALGRPA
ncbi:MAG: hypothetical protein GY832_14910 [Chloroflexi bacterium]|nr:hypothetical protein [Chloroflexota bacterium]